jgi:signal transduction histidine kinase
MISRLKNRKNIELKLNQASENNVLVYGDRIKLTQAVSNLLNNAVKFTNEGIISMTLKKENDKAIVSYRI